MELIDERELILQTASVLHANGQSTAITLVAVDRLNRGMCASARVIPWASTHLVRSVFDGYVVALLLVTAATVLTLPETRGRSLREAS